MRWGSDHARVRQAVFLVGGAGTRLGQLTAATPKPLLEVAPDLPFLDVLLENTARQGFDRILLLAGFHGDQIYSRYAGKQVNGATISVVCEDEPAGTGGALVNACEALDPWFILSNGDTYFDINLRALAAKCPDDVLGIMALRREADAGRYGSVRFDGDRVSYFGEKVEAANLGGIANGGIYLLSRDVVSHLAVPSSLELDLFPKLAEDGLLAGQVFDGYFLDMGLPETLAQAIAEIPTRRSRPAAFLDRDGVLNVDVGYAHRPGQLEWVKGARQAVRYLNDAGYFVFVVTNQSGVARGLYSEAHMQDFHDLMQDMLAVEGAHIDAFYHCPFHRDAVIADYRVDNHPDRKPNPGMLNRALTDWPVSMEGSFLVGDQASDIAAANAAGIDGFLFHGDDLLSSVQALCAAHRDPIAAAVEA